MLRLLPCGLPVPVAAAVVAALGEAEVLRALPVPEDCSRSASPLTVVAAPCRARWLPRETNTVGYFIMPTTVVAQTVSFRKGHRDGRGRDLAHRRLDPTMVRGEGIFGSNQPHQERAKPSQSVEPPSLYQRGNTRNGEKGYLSITPLRRGRSPPQPRERHQSVRRCLVALQTCAESRLDGMWPQESWKCRPA